MGQACCKGDDAKVMQPGVIPSKKSSGKPKGTGLLITDLATPRSLLGVDKHAFEEPPTSILSPKDRPGQNLLNPKAIRTDDDRSTSKEDNFVCGSGSKIYFDASGKRIFKYKRGTMIDSNSDYVETWECLDLITGERLAVKSYEILGDLDKAREDLESLYDDIYLWRELRHTNLIKCYDIEMAEDLEEHKFNIDVIMEYASGGSIESLVCKFNTLDEKIVQYYTRQVLEGLSYLHSQGSVHGNLRGSNILIDSTGVVKLTDFEMCHKIKAIAQENLSEDNMIHDAILWAAPEVLAENRIEPAADVWSVGCVVIEMLTGNPPWMPLDKRDAFRKIISAEAPPIANEISDVCRDFLTETFKYPPEERLKIDELLEHPFINQSSKNSDASYIGESFLTLQTLKGNHGFQSMHTLPRHLSKEDALDNPNRTRISLSHMNIIRAKTLRRDSKYSEGGTEENLVEAPARLKRNITLERYRLDNFQSRESFRRQATLPQVYEIKDEEDEYYPSHDKLPWNRQYTGGRSSVAGTPAKKVPEIHTAEFVFEHKESNIKSIDLSARTKPDEYNKKGQGQQVLSSEGDFLDEKYEIRTDPDYGSDDEEKENESEKHRHGNNNFAPVKRSKFQNQKIEIINDYNESLYVDQEDHKSSTKAKTPTLSKEEERKRIEAEIMNEIFASSDKTFNKTQSIQSQSNKGQPQTPAEPIDDKEAQRRKIEEEIMRQLERIDSNDLSHQSSFKGEAAYSDGEYVVDQ